MTCFTCGLDCYEEDDGTLVCEGCDEGEDFCNCEDDNWCDGDEGNEDS